ncbi:MAG: carbon-nitrogen hydrolase family protein [Fimbriimonadaceae bacterium]|nr:carbon-nitrogen hydrolase family protein [Fimbriimonadaceae bacterium]
MTRVAVAQSDVVYGDAAANVRRSVEWLERAQAEGVDLLLLPEAFLTGYAVADADKAAKIAVEVNANEDLVVTSWDPVLDRLQSAVDAGAVHVVVGFVGRDILGLYNGALLLTPGSPSRVYRKTHLPHLGVDRFVRPGDRLVVWDTEIGKIGPLICFDLRVPEAARTLALLGAELIVLPTNWPNGASITPCHIAPTRAGENKVWLAACDRVGSEGGFTFIGQSGIFDPYGNAVAQAGEAEEFLVADIDLTVARDKRNVIVAGEYEIDPFATRQPSLYMPLTG